MPPKPPLPETASVANPAGGAKLSAPSAARNAGAIRDVLLRHAPPTGRALEIASGTGEHALVFARALPGLTWQPTDLDVTRCRSIDAWAAEAQLGNLRPARVLNATAAGWAADLPGQDLIVVVNLLHLIGAEECRRLLHEVAAALASQGRFVLYGPFLREGRTTSQGDARFNADLIAHDPRIGYKDRDAVAGWLHDAGLVLVEVIDMPANNLCLVAEPADARTD